MTNIKDIAIKTRKPSISFDYQAAEKELDEHLKDYALVVTAETVAGAKQTATELNKQATWLDHRRKDVIREVSEPIAEADQQIKQLVAKIKDGRQKILDQVKVFEDETREQIAVELNKLRDDLRAEMNIEREFYQAEFDDLIKLTAFTKAGKLTGPTITEMRSRVNEELTLQNQTKMRLLELENRSYKAGLTAPLMRQHVERFLYSDDDQYQAELDKLLDAELEREQLIQQRRDEERERQQRIDQSRNEPALAPEPEPEPQPAPELEPVQQKIDTKSKAWKVTANFNVSGSTPYSREQVINALRMRLEKAGLSTLSEITAEPK